MDGPLRAAPYALVLAQEAVSPSDDTERTVVLVIGALLALAVLLAVLTFWYWRRTDPRKRVQSEVRAPAASPPVDSGAMTVRARPRASASRPASTAGAAGATAATGRATGSSDDRGISAEEWLRLTGSGQSGTTERS